MNAAKPVCASSGNAKAWEQLDWPQHERNVRRLQARIVKATQAGRWNKVKALQRLLTCSFSGKALAVKRVTENQGKRTSGVDRVIWSTPASKHKAIALNWLEPDEGKLSRPVLRGASGGNVTRLPDWRGSGPARGPALQE